jgi:hypothetical protein
MNIWEVSILKIIDANDGSATLKHIYSELPHYIALTIKHEEIKYRVPNYHHQTRAHIDDLMDSGDLVRIGKGTYCLTAKGHLRIGSNDNSS